MAWTLCTSGSCIYKAGANASTLAITSGAMLADYSEKAEGSIVSETRRDWLTYYSNLCSGVKFALADAASDLIAMKIINYDMSNYASRTEAQTMLDVLRDNVNRNLTNLKDFKSNEIKEP